ncbi:hypothetical protein QBC35DRAFT_383562 [Podospora australis]|uniref:Uncharacterized protein n=1 Tax=Podospora australis TaxID=1536484 RepID=A0AAN6WTA8_9PEZI|nr:hypothetical protein QBC35DRAFT_383562 [Podospora australis]
MCCIEQFRGCHCTRNWVMVTNSCGPGMGFSTCPSLLRGYTTATPPMMMAQGQVCPAWYVVS